MDYILPCLKENGGRYFEKIRMNAPKISLNDFLYELPDERIAKFPVTPRDSSKLLIYQNGNISHCPFSQLPELLPEKTLMVFNNTKVIPARLFFQKGSGSWIELFLLEPLTPTNIVALAMQQKEKIVWKCLIGGLKKWKDGEILSATIVEGGKNILLRATLVNRAAMEVALEWSGDFTFSEVIQIAGELPIPPYLKRAAQPSDKEQYQTVYAQQEGAVAAPTAGLHFTDDVFESLKAKGIEKDFLTLHVSAGTFQPVKEMDDVSKHEMHSEQFSVTTSFLEKLLQHTGNIIPVGTTSMRTLESLYWMGCELIMKEQFHSHIEKLHPYQFQNNSNLPEASESINALIKYMNANGFNELSGSTSIFIMPGYRFRMCKALVTNFHQPGSTLILLVAAFIGSDWKKVYDYALKNDFRFLSYGDSSVLFP